MLCKLLEVDAIGIHPLGLQDDLNDVLYFSMMANCLQLVNTKAFAPNTTLKFAQTWLSWHPGVKQNMKICQITLS